MSVFAGTWQWLHLGSTLALLETMSNPKDKKSWRLSSLLAATLFLSLGSAACVSDEQPLPTGNSETADELDDRWREIYIMYDYSYVDVTLTGVDGEMKLRDSFTNRCDKSSAMLGTGDANNPMQAVAWRGGAQLWLESSESTQLQITQRPIPGCGNDAGTEEPTEADLAACETIKQIVANTKDALGGCSST